MKNSMRLLLLTTFYPPFSFGGDAVYAWRLADALAEDGHRVDVIHCADGYEMLARGRPLPPPLPQHPNVTVWPLRSTAPRLVSLLAHQTGRPIGHASQIASAIRGKSYDVIHFNNISMFGPEILRLQTAGTRPIKLFTMQEYWLVCASHLLWKFGSRSCESPQCFECVLRARRPPQLWRHSGLIERTASCVDRFLAPSRAVARIHTERGFRHPMEHFPLFTDVPEDRKLAALARPFPQPYWFFAGRLESYKGAADLLDAWIETSKIDLVIAGDGSELEALRRRTAGNPRVHLVGHVAQPDLSAFYHHAFGCVVPSRFEEPFGLVAIESLAHRTPVIARDTGGLREIVGESGGGFLFDNVAQLADTMCCLESNAGMRDRLAEKGRRYAQQAWSVTAHQSRYYALLEEIRNSREHLAPTREQHEA